MEAQVFVWKGCVEGHGQRWELGEAISGAYDDGDEIEVGEMGGEGRSVVGDEAELGNLRLDGDGEWALPPVFGGGKVVDANAVEW